MVLVNTIILERGSKGLTHSLPVNKVLLANGHVHLFAYGCIGTTVAGKA